ncbi:hypothetical protein GCM10010206_17960 [Streptomyces cinerochromogenes]|nr:hypothetical protein GCM10010206_17960 [Streptomyces cinerochromogenes]
MSGWLTSTWAAPGSSMTLPAPVRLADEVCRAGGAAMRCHHQPHGCRAEAVLTSGKTVAADFTTG